MAKLSRIFFSFIVSLFLFITISQGLVMLDHGMRPLPIRNVHDYLSRLSLPEGLIPSSVKSYDRDTIDLALEIELEHPCYAEIGGKLFHFDKVIRGYINHGTIFDLSGVRRKKFLSWLPVTRVGTEWRQIRQNQKDGVSDHYSEWKHWPQNHVKVVKIYYPRDGVSSWENVYEEFPAKQFSEVPMCKKANMDWLWMFHVSDF